MHCFTGTKIFAKKLLEINAYFSASGIITFKKTNELKETFKTIPLSKILIETDAPYLSPEPLRGKSNGYMLNGTPLSQYNSNDLSPTSSIECSPNYTRSQGGITKECGENGLVIDGCHENYCKLPDLENMYLYKYSNNHESLNDGSILLAVNTEIKIIP